MAIFGRVTARRRLRRAIRESLAIPAFTSPLDCTQRVTGGLWPAELMPPTAETASAAECLNADLQRIADNANDVLKVIQRAGLVASVRQDEETRVIEEARALAVHRVQSTVRQLRAMDAAGSHLDIPAQTAPRPQTAGAGTCGDAPATGRDDAPQRDRHHARAGTAVGDAMRPPQTEAVDVVAGTESAGQRLRRLLAFVARQEPRLNWAVGDRSDGTTVLANDLAHGWIPPGISLPAEVRLPGPGRRTGAAAALLGETTRTVTYTPGDRLGWPDHFTRTKSSVQPRELPAIEDWERVLSDATRWRHGLPRIVHPLARAAAEGASVAEDEVDLLRVHRDTALHQLMIRHPDAEPALLLSCFLLAATAAALAGDPVSANYHLAWFQELDTPA